MANKNEQVNGVSAEAQINKTEEFFQKNKKSIIIGIIALFVIAGGVVAFNRWNSSRSDQASTVLAKGQDLFAGEQFEKALNGDGASFPGFLKVADEYGSTDAGNLSKLYAGLCYAKLGKWEEAATWLDKFSARDDQMISPAAEGALGNAYAHLNQLDKAVKHLKNAAEKADNNSLSPVFLIQAGEILESQGKKAEALALYQQIKTKYFNSYQYQSIDKYIERVAE